MYLLYIIVIYAVCLIPARKIKNARLSVPVIIRLEWPLNVDANVFCLLRS